MLVLIGIDFMSLCLPLLDRKEQLWMRKAPPRCFSRLVQMNLGYCFHVSSIHELSKRFKTGHGLILLFPRLRNSTRADFHLLLFTGTVGSHFAFLSYSVASPSLGHPTVSAIRNLHTDMSRRLSVSYASERRIFICPIVSPSYRFD
jgi:hypothetical protein